MTTATEWSAVVLLFFFSPAGLAPVGFAGTAQAPEQRTKLVPRLVPGQVLVYQSDFRAISEVQVTGAVENPQAPK